MLFTSLRFLCFLAALTVFYYLLPRRCQPALLLAASLYLYYSLSRKLIVFVLFSALVTWAGGLLLDRLYQREQQAAQQARAAGASREQRSAARAPFQRRRRWVMLACWACNLGFLLIFKFYNHFVAWMAEYGASFPVLRLAMPLGISFYTLQILSYTMDVYSGKQRAEKSYFRVLLFTCYFPQIMQGPISRYDALSAQLFAAHSFDWDRFVLGASRILWGYFKKLVIADRFAILTSALYNGYETYQGFYVIVAAVLYTFQLYTDFSGGIDIALGASEILGITLCENFQRPLFSKSIDEFWRRWHITLGAWLRDYVFYPVTFSKPLAKLKKSFTGRRLRWAAKWIPTYLALAFLWFCSGIWHGEGLQYICNGLWHGIVIMIGTTIETPSRQFWEKHGVRQDSRGLALFRVCRTFCILAIGEIMFGASSFSMMCGMFRGLFSVFNPWILWDGSLLTLGLDGPDLAVGLLALAVLAVVSLKSRARPMREQIAEKPLWLRWTVYFAGILTVLVFGIYGANYPATPFIYFQF